MNLLVNHSCVPRSVPEIPVVVALDWFDRRPVTTRHNTLSVHCSDVNTTFLSRQDQDQDSGSQDQDQDLHIFFKTKTKTLSFKTKTKTKTLPGPLNRLPYHGHKMNKTVYTRQ